MEIRRKRLLPLGCVLISAVASAVAQYANAAVPPAQPAVDLKKMINALATANPDDRKLAEGAIGRLPWKYLPDLEKIEADPNLAPMIKSALTPEVASMRRHVDAEQKKRAVLAANGRWYAAVALNDYDHDGHTDPRWDADAKKGISDAWLRLGSEVEKNIAMTKSAQVSLHSAMDAGCTDPTVLLSAGLVEADLGSSSDTVFGYFEKADTAVKGTLVSPYFRVIVDGRVIRDYGRGYRGGVVQDNLDDLHAHLDDMVSNFVKLTAVQGVPVAVLVDIAEYINKYGPLARAEPVSLFNHFFPALEKVAASDQSVLRFKGVSYIDLAWVARGKGLANTITPQGAADFGDRLAIANESLTKAWQLDPTDPVPPTRMLSVELGQGKGKDIMELWFKRAMVADPENYEACWRKQLYLEPKWYGTPAELVDFSRQCLHNGDFRTEIPMIIVSTYGMLGKLSGSPLSYYRQDWVWRDLTECFNGYLARNPDDAVKRTGYAVVACAGGRWEIAQAQFDKLGDTVDVAQFGNQATLERIKAKVTAQLKADHQSEGK